MGRVFTNGPGDPDSIVGRVIPKIQKCYLIPPCLTLSTVRYISRVKWSNPWKIHLGIVAIENGAFGSLSTRVENLIFTLITLVVG